MSIISAVKLSLSTGWEYTGGIDAVERLPRGFGRAKKGGVEISGEWTRGKVGGEVEIRAAGRVAYLQAVDGHIQWRTKGKMRAEIDGSALWEYNGQIDKGMVRVGNAVLINLSKDGDWDTLSGQFSNDTLTPGQEYLLTTKDGQKYTGRVGEGKFGEYSMVGTISAEGGGKVEVDGQGRAVEVAGVLGKDGLQYTGGVRENCPHGNGTLTSSRMVYSGQWKDGLPEGNGEISGGGVEARGVWREGGLVKGRVTPLVQNSPSVGNRGISTPATATQPYAEGHFQDGLLHGHALLSSNHCTLEGEWRFGKREGRHIFKGQDGLQARPYYNNGIEDIDMSMLPRR